MCKCVDSDITKDNHLKVKQLVTFIILKEWSVKDKLVIVLVVEFPEGNKYF